MLDKYLDAAKSRNEIRSDSKLADAIGVSRGAVSHWRQGKPIDHDQLAKLARLCGMRADELIAEYELTRTHVPEVRQMWERIAGHAAIWMIVATAAISATAITTYSEAKVSNNIYYVKLIELIRACIRSHLKVARL